MKNIFHFNVMKMNVFIIIYFYYLKKKKKTIGDFLEITSLLIAAKFNSISIEEIEGNTFALQTPDGEISSVKASLRFLLTLFQIVIH